MHTRRRSDLQGWKILIAAASAAALVTGAGCRDDSAQPRAEIGEGQVDMELAPQSPGAPSSPEAADPGATRPGESGAGAGDPAAAAGEPGAESETAVPAPEPGDPAASEQVVSRQELPSGLVIEDLVIGEGDEAPPGATVTIHYDGRLTDGTQFDSSYDDGEPATFPLNRLIAGWQEGIPGMREGGKRRLRIPWQLAYGEQGRPPVIPPRADLVFVIELFEVK